MSKKVVCEHCKEEFYNPDELERHHALRHKSKEHAEESYYQGERRTVT